MKTLSYVKLSVFTLLLASFGLLFQSCHNKKVLTQNELTGVWVLKTINGKEAKKVFAGAIPTLQFDFENNTVFGTGGCNRYTGSFSYQNGIFAAPKLATTRMLCTEDNLEGEFLLELSNVNNTLDIVDGTLNISHDGKTVLVFEKGTLEENSEKTVGVLDINKLEGTWTLQSIDGNEADSSFVGEGAIIPTLTFNLADKKIMGKGGCNSYNSTFSIEGNTMIVGPIALTRMTCPNIANETRFLQAISDTTLLSMPNESTLQIAKKDVVQLVLKKSQEEIK